MAEPKLVEIRLFEYTGTYVTHVQVVHCVYICENNVRSE
jgi:hypothetical protein